MAERESDRCCIQSIRIDPPAERWEAMIRESLSRRESTVFHRTVGEWIELTRRELVGHDGGSLVVATGHQAAFWHPGILAKYLAVNAFAESQFSKVSIIELVVDQDATDPLAWSVPVRIETESSSEPNLARQFARLDEPAASDVESERAYGLPDARKPVVHEVACDSLTDVLKTAHPESARRGLVSMMNAIADAAPSSDQLAEQVSQANRLVRDAVFGPPRSPRSMVVATHLSTMTLWRELIGEMRRYPKRAADLYNEAIARFPDAGLAPMSVQGDRCELPLWVIDETTGHRRRAWSDDLAQAVQTLWPRALLMTGLVRLALVDLFVHGRGGAIYDRATEAWFRSWLGVELAPMAFVSADVFLDFGVERASMNDVSRARWHLHHLKNNLDREAADDPAVCEHKRELLRRINALPRRSIERYNAYLELQAFQERLRERYASHLRDAERVIAERERSLAEQSILEDRSWPFPYYDRETLIALQRRIRDSFNADRLVGSLEDAEPTESLCVGCCSDL